MNYLIDITLFEDLIIQESLNQVNGLEEYQTLFNNFGFEYLKNINRSVRPFIPAEARLALCICIVGSLSLDDFGVAMILLLPLEDVGGAYWVVQEELFRHYSLHLMKGHVDISSKAEEIRQLVELAVGLESAHNKVLTQSSMNNNEILVEKLSQLEVALRRYCVMMNHHERRASISASEKLYPIESFRIWFVGWARDVIVDLGKVGDRRLFPAQFSELHIESKPFPTWDASNYTEPSQALQSPQPHKTIACIIDKSTPNLEVVDIVSDVVQFDASQINTLEYQLSQETSPQCPLDDDKLYSTTHTFTDELTSVYSDKGYQSSLNVNISPMTPEYAPLGFSGILGKFAEFISNVEGSSFLV